MIKSLSISKRLFLLEPLQRCKLKDCFGACCEYGVWIDLKEKERILDHSNVIVTCMDEEHKNPEIWFDDEMEDDSYTESGWVVHSRLVWKKQPFKRKTCIFLRSDHKCALQVASEKLKKHHWFLKPFYCILHPLELNEFDQISLDDTQVLMEEARSCLRKSQQLTAPIIIFEEELRYLLGNQIFENGLSLAQDLWKLKTNKEEK